MKSIRRGRQGVQGIQGVEGLEGHGEKGDKGEKGDRGKAGANEPIHPWRWRALGLWIAIMTVVSYFAIQDGRHVDKLIQDERRLSIILNCEAQNRRHDNTIKVLDQRINEAKRGQSAERQAQLNISREHTALLIDALAPKVDCEREARLRVNPPKGSGIP